MKIKSTKILDSILENTFVVSNDIYKTIHRVILESDEIIENELIKDLKDSLINSYTSLESSLDRNQASFIYESTNQILISYSNINKIKRSDGSIDKIVSELNTLNDKLCSISKCVYMEQSDEEYVNNVIESFIKSCSSITNTNTDLYSKELLCLNKLIDTEFSDVYNNSVTGLMEGLIGNIAETLNKIKGGFGNKHDKIVERDKKWLNTNKKKVLALKFDDIQLEVLSDYKVTFENLLNRHNTFDKIFVNSSNHDDLASKLSRFEDKSGNLKNGLDNYFRTGTSRREIGLRKVSGPEAKTAVENMIAYCESFLAGRKYLEEKINNIMTDLDKIEVKESAKYSHIFNGVYNPYNITSLTEAVKEDEEPADDDLTIEDEEPADDNKDDKNKVKDVKDTNRGMRDRQTGIAVLLTVSEERYFDYINIIKGLSE